MEVKDQELEKPVVADDTKGDEASGKDGGEAKNKELTVTQAQIDQMISDRLAREKKKADEDRQKAVDDAIAEERRLAKLSAVEKEKELELKKEKELTERERNLAVKENRSDAVEKLAELGVPTTFVDFIVTEDKDKTLERVNKLADAWSAALQKGIEDKLKGEPPIDPKKEEKDSVEIPVRNFL